MLRHSLSCLWDYKGVKFALTSCSSSRESSNSVLGLRRQVAQGKGRWDGRTDFILMDPRCL